MMNRLSRIEGQIRGIKGLLEDDTYCIDILTQVEAAKSALVGFSKELLANHIKNCVVNDLRGDDEQKAEESLDELIAVLQKFMQ